MSKSLDAKGPARLRLRVTAAAESILRSGHPWLFADSIREQNRDGRPGELAVIYDRKDRFLAVGLFDPESPIRVRILHAGKPQTVDEAWWTARLEQALARRQGLFDAQTTGFRLINGESDGWPGLVLDRYGRTLVLKLYTAAWLPRLEEVAGRIARRLLVTGAAETGVQTPIVQERPAETSEVKEGCETPERPARIFHDGRAGSPLPAAGCQPALAFCHARRAAAVAPERRFGAPRRRKDCAPHHGSLGAFRAAHETSRLVLRLSRNIQTLAREQFGRTDGQILDGPGLTGPVVFLETGLWFEADVLRGQKTGFFLDQRENRRRVESLARGRRVLNAFSFSGGFSLYAARGGARSVADLDISAHALESARRNFSLNQSDAAVAGCPHEVTQADAFEWLGGNADRLFDMVILDPPSLAKREAERAGAIRTYGVLAGLGLKHLAAGGVLLACSCSAHVGADEFFQAIRQAAGRSGRPWRELETARHAPDHPATIQEAQYLKAIYLEA